MQQKKNHINTAALLLLLCICVISAGCDVQKKEPQKNARLANATSPYLREHADNPVNWYEWGDDALALAKKENKPLLISIGYAACHWCHVMENECYMDTAVARIMNEHFICIKVDREERPDIDKFYSNALQLLTGSSGWPLHAFALPDGKPFFAGTYYPKSRYRQLLLDISAAFNQKQKLVITQANALANGIASNNLVQTPGTDISKTVFANLYHDIAGSLVNKLDPLNGGLKGAPKFPNASLIEFLLEHYYLTGNKQALAAATTHLKKMALGGIYDQLEGGFARYSSDSTWNKPHFEKMLYDNGLLVSAYSHAWQLTRDTFYRQITAATIDFIQQYLAAPEGGYYSSLNADTEAGEGASYTWSEKEFRQLTGNNNQVAAYYHVTGPGNLGDHLNVLFASTDPVQYAGTIGIEPAAFSQSLHRAKQQLRSSRKKRKQPSADTKIICAWNSILLKGLADAYAATSNPDYLFAANRCARFIEKYLLLPGGQLQRTYHPGQKGIPGFLDDYAWTATAFERLYEVSLDDHWLLLSKKLADHVVSNFYDPQSGLFFYTAAPSSAPGLRHTLIDDGEMPSANAVMAKLFRTLGAIFADSAYQLRCSRMMGAVSEKVRAQPVFYTEWGRLYGIAQAQTFEIAVSGKDAANKCRELHRFYLPACTITGSTVPQQQYPLLKDKWNDTNTLIYVCTENVCRRPETEVSKALQQVKQ